MGCTCPSGSVRFLRVVGVCDQTGGMGKRTRRDRLFREAGAVPLVARCGCGCSALGRIAYEVTCRQCGRRSGGELVMPTNGAVGDQREVYASCACGAEAAGTGRVVELLA